MKKNIQSVSTLCMGLFLLAGASYAAEDTSQSKQSKQLKQATQTFKTECRSDAEKLCKDVTPGEGRLASCLNSHEDKLSESCNQARLNLAQNLSDAMDKTELAFRKSCGSDVQKFCSEIPSGKGRLYDCITEHKEALSSSCSQFQAKVEKKLSSALG